MKILDKCPEELPRIPIDDLVAFQGELKRIRPASLERLKNQIKKNHFFAPVYVWTSRPDRGGRTYILDGHQRIKALQALEEDGHSIPAALPVLQVKAKSKNDAKGKLLALSSQYAKTTKRGLEKFLDDSTLEIELLAGEIEIGLDLEIKTEGKAPASRMVRTCPHCGHTHTCKGGGKVK